MSFDEGESSRNKRSGSELRSSASIDSNNMMSSLFDSDWFDVTDKFKEITSNELGLGELLHDPNFSLFEAMSAIELMDPKMDAGMIRTKKPLGFDGAVQSGKLKVENVSWVEQMETMDWSWGTVVSWLEGHSLVHTVFLNLYLHKPSAIKDSITRAFSLGLLKLVSIARDIILRAAVFEEEDFQPMNYDFYYAEDLESTSVMAMLKEAEEETHKAARQLRNGVDAENAELAEGVEFRLRFLRHFCLALMAMTTRESPTSVPKGQMASDVERFLRQCEQMLERIAVSIESEGEESISDEDYGKLMAFEPGVNRRLIPPTFPRRIRIATRETAFAYLQALVQRLQLVAFVLPPQAQSFGTALEFFRHFSRQRNCLLSRSVAQLTYLPNEDKVLNQTPFLETLRESIRTFVNPPVLQLKNIVLDNPECQSLWTNLEEDYGKVFPALIAIAGNNRARQREKLAAIIPDLVSIQEETDKAEGCFHSLLIQNDPKRHHMALLGNFVLYHVLRVMLEYFLLGFELQLYSEHEYAYIYWYMGEMVYKWLANVVNKVGNYIFEQEQYFAKQEKVKGEKKKGQKGKRSRNGSKTHRVEQVHWQTYHKLCEAYYRTMLGLTMLWKVRVPEYADGPEDYQLRYEHRMAPFAPLHTPTYIGYKQFLDMSGFREIARRFQADRILADAADSFQDARSQLESVPLHEIQESTALVRICKNNTIVLRLLASGMAKDAELPEFDFALHKHFPLLKLPKK